MPNESTAGSRNLVVLSVMHPSIYLHSHDFSYDIVFNSQKMRRGLAYSAIFLLIHSSHRWQLVLNT